MKNRICRNRRKIMSKKMTLLAQSCLALMSIPFVAVASAMAESPKQVSLKLRSDVISDFDPRKIVGAKVATNDPWYFEVSWTYLVPSDANNASSGPRPVG